MGHFTVPLKKQKKKTKKWEVRYPPKSEPLIQYCFKLYTHILPNISNAFPQILA